MTRARHVKTEFPEWKVTVSHIRLVPDTVISPTVTLPDKAGKGRSGSGFFISSNGTCRTQRIVKQAGNGDRSTPHDSAALQDADASPDFRNETGRKDPVAHQPFWYDARDPFLLFRIRA
ncbi:hypothetical protein [Komagataeibacter europaeus]|uniref:hypothetical protein n=1 Tax=Komagataeibacter europaeus TaxID=33995 RepID=UPI0015F87E6B|nr:hypothetical protein [Komagataeibacter europaeus]